MPHQRGESYVEHRSQQTIAREAEVAGVGFLWGADVRLKFLPAEPNYGIQFVRTDLGNSPSVPALVEFTVPQERRTVIENGGTRIEMIEHVMAALAGLQVDNCRVEVNAPEPPGCDGSSIFFADAIAQAGIVAQDQPRKVVRIQGDVVAADDRGTDVRAQAVAHDGLEITYELDYGPNSPIEAHTASYRITPETFLNELAFSRTFVLEAEADALKAQGYGARLTAADLVIFGQDGPIENKLRAVDECARHKLLDCIGDLALIGCDLQGHVIARRSGHRLNAEIVRRLKLAHSTHFFPNPETNGECRAA
ncbi:UDP-3-O-[3-hydroxymyristoyl] N-acetylglucosamine deacetylase [Symmachiella dynata]|uniref:UDP-3-O-acyl-N-acetylglucosamine deacetylase n=1 Tax=Symmachiella dynata TaxID=2527995 RepID=A0A517ZUU0_9PLAN|nr:UDP-3-O-acyl-N-acetylglucosamine deacetylase [Symmachiella dynata]QDU46254.1 UDP-3-O-[3-hydroxymyristoyl] N-acetylglucosamine deacetylase [Symmachiella dynata]